MGVLMLITNSITPIEREGFGTVVFLSKRLPFRFFFRKGQHRIFFKPALVGAGWHELDTKVNLEEFLSLSDAFTAMSFIRTNGLVLDKPEHK